MLVAMKSSSMKRCRMLKTTSGSAFVILFSFLFVSVAANAQTTGPDPEKQLAHDIYKQFIEIPSGFTTGSTSPVAQAAAARLQAAGFADADIFLGGASPKKENLVVRYHGSGKRKPILLLAHIDVVEAKREDWSIDPFQLTEKDGYFYGRGTGDDKAQAAIWIANLMQYKKEGFVPDRDLIVALTADEEGGGPFNGVVWLLKNHRELIDADFCLNEGGWGEIIKGKHVANYLQVSEKYVMNFRLEVHNKGGHSSLPVPDNAIYRLAAALTRLSNFAFPWKTNEITSAYFRRMSEIDSSPLKQDLLQVSQGAQDATQRVASAAPAYNATLRTTCIATQLEGGHAVNALPQLAAATVNCRVLPEDSPQYVEESLRKAIADDQVSLRVMGEPEQGPASPLRPDVLDAATRVTSRLWPGVQVVPNMVMGATDGRPLRIAGIPTYGIQGIFIDRDDIRFHGRDERIYVQSFYEGQAFLYDLVKSLSSAGN
jgi:acetylornithine deacetylase/succinyl-diaminopimelate desuccinylase-like protein